MTLLKSIRPDPDAVELQEGCPSRGDSLLTKRSLGSVICQFLILHVLYKCCVKQILHCRAVPQIVLHSQLTLLLPRASTWARRGEEQEWRWAEQAWLPSLLPWDFAARVQKGQNANNARPRLVRSDHINPRLSMRGSETWLPGSDCGIVRAHPHGRPGAAGCPSAGTDTRTDVSWFAGGSRAPHAALDVPGAPVTRPGLRGGVTCHGQRGPCPRAGSPAPAAGPRGWAHSPDSGKPGGEDGCNQRVRTSWATAVHLGAFLNWCRSMN